MKRRTAGFTQTVPIAVKRWTGICRKKESKTEYMRRGIEEVH
mgnify:FL=1